MKDEEVGPCVYVNNREGNKIGAICVVAGKDFGKKSIILMKEDDKSESLRSTTQLTNKLVDLDVSLEEREKVLKFADKRLRALQEEYTKWEAGKFGFSKDKKI